VPGSAAARLGMLGGFALRSDAAVITLPMNSGCRAGADERSEHDDVVDVVPRREVE
jgi:hypothetical protein